MASTPHGIVGPLTTVDYHTGGEPFRIVTGGVVEPAGLSVLDRRQWAQLHLDDVRALLVNEPRGHADMYGCFVTPPDDDGAAFGTLFFHRDGFSTACGHGTIALATWAIDEGVIAADGRSVVPVTIDVPSGRLPTEVAIGDDGRPEAVTFWNVGAFVSADRIPVDTSRGSFDVAVAYGGAFYASVPVEGTGLDLVPGDVGVLIDLGREINALLVDHPSLTHPVDDRLSGLYGVIFHRELGTEPELEAAVAQRNVTIFADGQVDRSPCGSGTSARLAVLHGQGRLGAGERFINESIVGARFEAAIEGARVEEGGRCVVATRVTGSAFRVGDCRFSLDERDPLGLGFQLR